MPTLKEQVRARIDDGDYEGAIALLKTVNTPGARQTIEKLKKKIAEDEPVSDPPVLVDRTAANVLKFVVIVSTLAVLVGAGYLAFDSAQRGRVNAERSRLWRACRDAYEDSWATYKTFTINQVHEGCWGAVDQAKDLYEDEINYCLGNMAETDVRLTQCLDEQQVVFSYSILANTPKE